MKLKLLLCLLFPLTSYANVIINLPAKTMWIEKDDEILEYPVAIGKPSSPSPIGEFNISEIRHNPAWFVPPAIQKEMAAKGKTVQTVVKAGPKNPLGSVFIRLGNTSYGFHGTNVPKSIGFSVSHGCIRMNNEHVKEVATFVKRGDSVKLIYEPIVLDLSDDEPKLTVYPNVYGKKNVYNSEKIWENLDASLKTAENEEKVNNLIKKMEKSRSGNAQTIELKAT